MYRRADLEFSGPSSTRKEIGNGARGTAYIQLSRQFQNAVRCNILKDDGRPVKLEGKRGTLDYGPTQSSASNFVESPTGNLTYGRAGATGGTGTSGWRFRHASRYWLNCSRTSGNSDQQFRNSSGSVAMSKSIGPNAR